MVIIEDHPFLYKEHYIVDTVEKKKKASKYYWGWTDTSGNIFDFVDKGHIVVPGLFAPCQETNTFRHLKKLWGGTHLLALDGDNIKDKDHPEGVEPFTDFDGYKEYVRDFPIFAIAMSASAMSEERPYMRYRIWIYTDKFITNDQMYSKVLKYCQSNIEIADKVNRHPAQPVVGFKKHETKIIGDILKVDDIKEVDDTLQLKMKENQQISNKQSVENRVRIDKKKKIRKKYDNLSLPKLEYKEQFENFVVNYLHINRRGNWTNTTGGVAMQIDCPWNTDHKGDAYLFFGNKQEKAINCHHNSCSALSRGARGSGFKQLYESYGFRRKEYKK